MIGVFLDAIRNGCFERVVDCLGKRRRHSKVDWWDFFFLADHEKVEQMHEYYFAYYELDINFAIASFLLILCSFLRPTPTYAQIVLVLILVFFSWDGWDLRKEMKQLALDHLSGATDTPVLPHEGVYTRLRCSPIDGVGVFAISDIPQGAALFKGDDTTLIRVDAEQIRNLPSQLRRLYDDFCVLQNGKYVCPTNFNTLTVGWYINDARRPETANVRCHAASLEFFALRDIRACEELLVDYSSYSDPPGLLASSNAQR